MLIECIPNISEGRDPDKITLAAEAVRSVPGCTLMDIESDADHNRSVFSFLGEPEAVLQAAFNLAQFAVEHIDLTKHQGAHPRMGAIDVIPFVPLKDATMDDCVQLSKRLGERMWAELKVPSFLYEKSATAPHRQNLAKVREGQFEGLAEKMRRPEWAPDYGECTPHETAGAVAVGARMPLVAFNINLSTEDVKVAKAIAKIIRESSGGLRCVKALGIYLGDKHCAQVSINMTDYTVTPLYRVLELVKAEAARYGVTVMECEVIGLSPMNALIDSAMYYMQLNEFSRDRQVLENYLL